MLRLRAAKAERSRGDLAEAKLNEKARSLNLATIDAYNGINVIVSPSPPPPFRPFLLLPPSSPSPPPAPSGISCFFPS